MLKKISFFDIIGTMIKYVLIVVLILFFIRKAKDFYRMGYSIFDQKPVAAEGQGVDVTVTITNGLSSRDLAAMLKENGLIEDTLTFLIQERLSEYHNEWKAGTYILSTEMTTDEMLAEISPGEESEDGTE